MVEDGAPAPAATGNKGSPSSMAGEFGITDPRVEIVADYLLRSYKLKPDKWVKFYNNQDNQVALITFWDSPDKDVLIVFASSSLEIDFKWPTDPPKEKFSFFLRRNKNAKITFDNFREEVVYGDLFPGMLEHLSLFVSKVATPLIVNQNNNFRWPRVVTDDVLTHMDYLKTTIEVTLSKVKGQTILRIPTELADFDSAARRTAPRSHIHLIETCIVGWSNDLQSVLKVRVGDPLLEGKNPTPTHEIRYWDLRAKDLDRLYQQLISPPVKAMVRFIKHNKSVYYQVFKDLYSCVVGESGKMCFLYSNMPLTGVDWYSPSKKNSHDYEVNLVLSDFDREHYSTLAEAVDNNGYMQVLGNALDTVENAEFDRWHLNIGPLVWTVCGIWAYSDHYNTPVRITVLLHEICNFIIDLVEGSVNPEDMFKGEIADSIGGVKVNEHVMSTFVAEYERHRKKITTMFKDVPNVKPWKFKTSTVFERFNKVHNRLKTAIYIMETYTNFMKLEKVDFGGIRGNALGEQVQAIFHEFDDAFKMFTDCKYNPLDTNDDSFLRDFSTFNNIMCDYDRRLGTIMCMGFHDCSSLESVFKLMDIMGPLLERALIKNDFDTTYPIVVKDMHAALDVCFSLYTKQMAIKTETGRMVVHKNMPQMAGAMLWAKEVYQRVSLYMPKYLQTDNEIKHSTNFKEVGVRAQQLKKLLDQVTDNYYQDWISKVDEMCSRNMQKPLLTTDPENHLLSVNYGNELVAILREVKYLSIRNVENIPSKPNDIYERRDLLFNYYANLMVITELYNSLITDTLDVEKPLIAYGLGEIDKQLEPATRDLKWERKDLWDYIVESVKLVTDLKERVKTTKANVNKMENMITHWTLSPLMERKEKQDNLLGLSDRVDVVKRRHQEIVAAGIHIYDLMAENMQLFNADPASEAWTFYVRYLDDKVKDGFSNVIACSLNYLLENMSERTSGPLFEIIMELNAPRISFTPEIEMLSTGGKMFWDVMDTLMRDIYNQASIISRLTGDETTYEELLEQNTELRAMKDNLIDKVDSGIAATLEWRDTLNKFSTLWVDNRDDYMAMFLKYAHVVSEEEIANAGDDGLPENPPTLDQFKERINYYEAIFEEIEGLQAVNIFHKWLRVDGRKFKDGLLKEVTRWGNMFKQHLIDRVTNGLDGLQDFIKTTMSGLSKDPQEGEFDRLVQCMELLTAVRNRQATTDNMFDPIKETIEMLKTCGVEMSEKVYTQLEELPDKWTSVKKRVLSMKQTVVPLQNNEMSKLRRKAVSFDVKQHHFRDIFRSCPAFFFDCKNAYRILNDYNEQIEELEDAMVELQEACGVFDVTLPDFKQLRTCRFELKLLKILWDYVIMVDYLFNFWKQILWSEIDVEQMDIDCKKLTKELRGLDKEMRAWDVYTGLEAQLKNMITSLRAVGELQNSAIRDRHWAELMVVTKVQFSMDEETCLDDLLALNLHKCEDDVHGIVDKAVKETSMEKTLRELSVTWATMAFIHEKHMRTGTTLLIAEEELIETLEDNQVQLQNMMTSKYIAHFLEEVSDWTQKLSTTDQVISIYMEVQRTWTHLESIFVGSDDIRKQLPEETDRFQRIDNDFKELVKEISVTKIAVDACTIPGLFERLETIQKELIICEKALAEYLETKRLAFPRFYFVSSADLLDILSNGNNPAVVSKQLTKLFDNMANLEIEKGGKVGTGMYSKENEFVQTENKIDLAGQVEIWLNRVQDAMRSTVRFEMEKAVLSYEDKPRDRWLFDYPAQVALCGTQIWWAAEVSVALHKLEEGYEPALKDYLKKQIAQLNALIVHLLGDLSSGNRQKIMTICTIDVHARDVVAKMILQKVDNGQCFLWLSQLRHRWDYKEHDCFANICDAQFRYDKEYLGNTPRLVITPLTDRCYITLTQSLHLVMGGAPAGPAGTGKTETTKDLGRALGIMVYVFNCSEQMDYKSIGNIFKGLSQQGAWGCFDEFNRISVEVLSVVAVQVKSIQDAIKEKKKRFNFMGETIKLVPTVGAFITMNPGYAGRAELPENLKALFRPCAMVVPDFELICEIMLVAEGFMEARLLARKFITLYSLCKELLSKQDHYDWGLRAIKSVLVVAGSLKRGDRNRPEDQVLMRALRDFNTPKIVIDDMPVFMGLIGDLFPALDVPRKRDPDFEKTIKQATVDLRLQPEENFILKVVQLQELFDVRHSVFILGNAGTGKSCVWKSLRQTNRVNGKKPMAVDLDPKSVTNDELFGIISPATREWRDGLFSVIMRDLANMTGDGPKWIVLDGDIDPMWIESLNTVMDDNKVLTLASNERITMTPSMRLLFEISNLRTATPATVSRAGILFLNPNDLGWNPYVQSWIDRRDKQTEKSNLPILFDKYVPHILETIRTRFKKITPITDIAHVHMLTYLLESLLTDENVPADAPKELYEIYFVFCCVWAFGGSMFQDQLTDHRVEFNKWWATDFKSIKLPSQGTVFDYYIDSSTRSFKPWTSLVPQFEFDPELPLQATIVHTAETIRLRFFLDMLISTRRPVMLVGGAGTGKTVLMQNKLQSLSEDYMIANVPFNFYTTSEMLQNVLEKPLEKKAGRNYGPPGTRKLIYFVDDMNMPEVDKYFTVQPHTLVRACIDHAHWYDRQKLTLKEIHNTQFVSCMNPTAGSFTIDARLQRHFCVFALSLPTKDALGSIYANILSQHMSIKGYNMNVQRYCQNLVQGAIAFQSRMCSSFLPTAIKFHYIFNLRDMSNIFQGMLFASADACKTPVHLLRLYFHEANRVYKDKLVDRADIELYEKIQLEILKKNFEEQKEEVVMEKPLICCHFANGLGDPVYDFIKDWATINKFLSDALDQYNELNAAMHLVLFEDAMSHVCRINRILEAPRGNALLIGVGGSGKQSLSRLASFLSGLDVFQITLSKAYGIPDLKNDLNALYKKSGLKGLGVVFLMSDAQVANEMFLVLINDLLASGEIPDLFGDDEVEEAIAMMMSECKQAGIPDTRENAWQFFIDRVRKNLKVVLCFSPVGSTLRVRSRKFPAVTNCTSINWFHEWPEEALISVSKRFLGENELLSHELKDSVSQFMAYVHFSVNESSFVYLKNEHRYNYTTPKSFLELIKLYQNLLSRKHEELQASIIRLENGLEKLRNTSSQVDDLKSKLASQEVELAAKNKEANDLIVVVSGETEKVTAEKVIADAEEEKVSVFAVDVEAKASDCQRDLAKAEPALLAAKEALNTLNKNNLTELKSFGSPPAAVTNVISAVMVLLAPGGNVPKDRSWKNAKSTIMAKVDHFLDALMYYDKDNIPLSCQQAVAPYLRDPEFDPDFIKAKSSAAAGLCSWVVNIMRYYEVFCEVEPKRLALNKANTELKGAQEKLVVIKAKVGALEQTLQECQAELNKAVDTKQKCQEQADMTAATILLANRLVGGLASENVRWAEAIRQFNISGQSLPGDVLIVSSYISYVGSFTKPYRVDLLEKKWVPYLKKLKHPIHIMENLDPLSMLVDGAQVALWNNEGLPGDRMSMENATILTSCERWPLMIDPQLQGYKWIKTKYGGNLKIVRLGVPGYLDRIEKAIELGDVLLMENIGESVDAVLDHLLGRNTIKKGKAIKIGDKEIGYHKDFKLILQTKLANPHYKPEMQAQTTLINFTVTRDGLEDQLLGAVVSKERPDLEKLKLDLTRQQNEFKIVLKDLEDNLLARLSTAEGNFLGDYALVENLETTKRTAAEIEVKAAEAKITEEQINTARECYRPAAARASILYFSMNDLVMINPIYQFSLKAFSVVFEKAIDRAEPADTEGERVLNLLDCITYSVFVYTSRGLFERDKLIFGTLMTFQVLGQMKMLDMDSLDFLLRYPATSDNHSPVDFLTDLGWGGIKVLSDKDAFKNLDKDIVGSAKRWKKFVEGEAPEKEKFPQEWKNKTPLEKLCMMRALRPDRMSNAVMEYIEEAMGRKYVENRALEFSKSFEESGPATPMFFILSPGVDPLKDVEKLGKKLGYATAKENFHNISLGQGQETVAEKAIDLAAKKGHWVVLQNVHLVARWLPNLEKKLEQYSENSHLNYRLFISAEPAATRDNHIIPQGILESSIKITNEPPTGMFANLHKALDNFNQDTLEMCSKEIEFKAVLFCLCYFHAVVCERRKFGAQGWNRVYPFNVGDLTISVNVLYNYLEANNKVPWEDLRYLFGEIMYGGHITDDWDRKLCRTYLEVYMNNDMFDSELLLAPGYPVPHNMDYEGFHTYIDDELPPESPYLYGLHPNAEIEFLSKRSENLLRTVFEQQPRDASSESGETVSREDKVKEILDDLTERLPDPFNMEEIMTKVPPDERTPYVVVAFQECERMNMLTSEIRRSLKELSLGLKGELTITNAMEELSTSLFMNTVPERWEKKAYPSLFMLAQWYSDMLQRARELDAWVADFAMPSCTWLGGFFNPQSFLTAIMQQMARKNEWPLDRMCLQCDVTKKNKEEMTSAPREGAYIHGLYMEGARWDLQTGFMAESILKELSPKMPVIYLKAIPVDRQDQRLVYECPVYKTKLRGPTFVWTFRLKTKLEPSKWVLGGVALLLQV